MTNISNYRYLGKYTSRNIITSVHNFNYETINLVVCIHTNWKSLLASAQVKNPYCKVENAPPIRYISPTHFPNRCIGNLFKHRSKLVTIILWFMYVIYASGFTIPIS